MCCGNCKNCQGNCNGNCGRCNGNKEESNMLRLTKTQFADIFGDLSSMLLLEEIVSSLQVPIMLGAMDGEEFIELLIKLHENSARDCKETVEGYGFSVDQTLQEVINEAKVVNGEPNKSNNELSKDNFCEIIHQVSCAGVIAGVLSSLQVIGSIDVNDLLDILIDIYHDLQEDLFHTLEDRYNINLDDVTVGDFLDIIEVIE